VADHPPTRGAEVIHVGRGLAEVEADVSRDARSRGGGRPSTLLDYLNERGTRFAPDPRNLAPLLQLLP
jgi:hypothetical protein